MSLEEFLINLDKQLQDYADNEKKKKEEEGNSQLFFRLMALYMTDGTPQNQSLNRAVDVLLNDPTLVYKIREGLKYVVAMTLSAIFSSQAEEGEMK